MKIELDGKKYSKVYFEDGFTLAKAKGFNDLYYANINDTLLQFKKKDLIDLRNFISKALNTIE